MKIEEKSPNKEIVLLPAPIKKEKSVMKTNLAIIIGAFVLSLISYNLYQNRSEIPVAWKNVSLATVSIYSLLIPNPPAEESEKVNGATSDEIINQQIVPEKKPIVAGPKSEKSYSFDFKPISEKTDLAVEITGIGKISANNNFESAETLKASDKIAVKFKIKNVGGQSVNSWEFSASLPTFPPYEFKSDPQNYLGPGDFVEFVLGFDNIEKTDGNIFKVKIDPRNEIPDSILENNEASVSINGIRF